MVEQALRDEQLPRKYYTFVRTSIILMGVLLIGVMLFSASIHPILPVLVPTALVLIAAAAYAVKRVDLFFFFVIGSFFAIARFEEGFQPLEAVYGLMFISFMFSWWMRNHVLSRAEHPPEWTGSLLLYFFVWAVISVFFTILYGGSLRGALSEGIALMFLGLFYPVFEGSARSEKFVRTTLMIIVGIGVIIVSRNVLTYLRGFESAIYVYEVARGRVITNEVLILASSLITLVTLSVARLNRVQRVVGWGIYTMLFAGLVLTQSRTYWVAFAFSTVCLFFLVSRNHRMRLLTSFVGSLLCLGAIGFIIVPDYVTLIISGLFERLTSIGSAASRDISMINRFLEATAVSKEIASNPILGHGMGTSYRFYDITFELTRVKAFIHNGYLGLWFKFGIIGLFLGLSFWTTAIYRGYAAFSRYEIPDTYKVAALASILVLVALLVTSLATNPFYLSDTTFVMGISAGLAVGSFHYARMLKNEGTS